MKPNNFRSRMDILEDDVYKALRLISSAHEEMADCAENEELDHDQQDVIVGLRDSLLEVHGVIDDLHSQCMNYMHEAVCKEDEV